MPFPTQAFGQKGIHKLFGVVTNRKDPGDLVIWWLRERCGKSEEVHSVMKSDLAGGQLPSGLFGANAAWWTLMILALNLNAVMKQLVLGKDWVTKRMKALRFRLIGLPGRVVSHARKLIIRLGAGAEALATFITARQTIRALACGPAGWTSTAIPTRSMSYRAPPLRSCMAHHVNATTAGLATVAQHQGGTRHPCGPT